MQIKNTIYTAFVFEKNNRVHLVFRSEKFSPILRIASSANEEHFNIAKEEVVLEGHNHRLKDWSKISDFRISSCGASLILTYLKNSSLLKPSLHYAESKDGIVWKAIGKAPSHNTSVVVQISGKKEKTSILYAASEKKYITCAVSQNDGSWRELGVILSGRTRMFDSSFLTPLTALLHRGNILLIYTARNGYGKITLGAAIMSTQEPETILWRTEVPLWEEPQKWKGKTVRIVGGVNRKEYFFLYAECDGLLETVAIPQYWERPYQELSIVSLKKEVSKKSKKKNLATKKSEKNIFLPPLECLVLERFPENPILEPNSENPWEAFAAFNPAAFLERDIVHFLYRAQGYNGLSVLGYAQSKDGYHISHRGKHPAYIPREAFEGGFGLPSPKKIVHSYMSAGGYGGCEDPKATLIEDRVCLTYVAFNGWQPPRIALSWIPLNAFQKKQWKKWSRPVLISPPGVVDKSAALFPEKIRGKYVIFHRIFPNILIDFVDSLETFDGKTYLKGEFAISPREGFWDRGKLSVGAPPIKTPQGWLVIYHAVSALIEEGGDLRYKIGAMLLDLENPSKVIVRSREPILEPKTNYENNGHKFGITYPCGAVIKNGTLFVYYGASDKTVAVATAPIDSFLKSLLAQKPFPMKKVSLKNIKKRTSRSR